MTYKVLIVDDMHEFLMQGLEQNGFELTYLPMASRHEILQCIARFHVLVVRSKVQVDTELLAFAKQLKLVARAGSGMDNIDEQACRARNIICVNAPEGNRDAVGEMALAQILNLTRNTSFAAREIQQYEWKREENRGLESDELTIAIVGFGHTGSALAKKLSGLNARVIYYDKYLQDVPTPYAESALWEQVMQQADVVSFHIPLDEENYQIIDKQMIEGFVKPFFLLNLSRGKIMKTEDVLWGLDQGLIRGAALDVLENESLSSLSVEEKILLDDLNARPNVVLTPHIAGWTHSSYRKISEVLLNKITDVLN